MTLIPFVKHMGTCSCSQAPNCPYLLSWVKINGFINKWFYFYCIWKAFHPCFLVLSLPPLVIQSERSFIRFNMLCDEKGKRRKLYMLLPTHRHMRSSYFVDLFMGICFHASILCLCCFSFMLCNLLIYVETIGIILYLVPVSLGRINFRTRIVGEVSMYCFDQIKALFCFTKHMLGC